MRPNHSSSETSDNETLYYNLIYISALATFNSERTQSALEFFDYIFKNGILQKQRITARDVENFCRKNLQRTSNTKRIRRDFIYNILSTYPLDVPVLWNLNYIIYRYGHLNDIIKKYYGFNLYTLIFVERAIRDLVYFCGANFCLLDIVRIFESRLEYADICNIAEPDNTYRILWQKCIFLPEEAIVEYSLDLIESFFTTARAISTIKVPRKFDEDELVREIKTVLDFLSLNSAPIDKYKDFPLVFLKPIFKVKVEGATLYAVPFPFLLGSLTVFRVESIIQESEDIRNIEDSSKGGKGNIAENLALDSLKIFPTENIIRDFRYKIGDKEYQSDGLLILKKSIWVVEVKSHPIFRKIPLDPEKIIPEFNKKVKEALKQGFRTLDVLASLREFQYHLSHLDKKFDKMQKGVIVVLDGYLPTLFTQNSRMDKRLGTHVIYNYIRNGYRVYVTTIMDLFLLSSQPDAHNFEQFLLWRTGYPGKMPIVAYNEREYWAYFNDVFLVHEDIRKVFPKLIENETTIVYISARFNFKKHLAKILENINKAYGYSNDMNKLQ